jgi:hypothetical protein
MNMAFCFRVLLAAMLFVSGDACHRVFLFGVFSITRG